MRRSKNGKITIIDNKCNLFKRSKLPYTFNGLRYNLGYDTIRY